MFGRGSGRLAGLVVAGALATMGCARSGPAGRGVVSGGPTGPGPSLSDRSDDVPLIGLQRGGRWSVITIRPPHLNGPQFHFVLKNGRLTGSVSGGTAPAGTLHVNIKEDGAEGYGPLGPVSLDYTIAELSTVVEGTWNGGRVHLVFAQDSLKGTVANNSLFYSKTNPVEANGMDMFRGRPGRPAISAADMIDPLPADQSCEYFLDKLGTDGALTGGSTCAGMPQATRLEVPRIAQAWLTRAELVTVLVAVLASPPYVVAEDYGPKFDGRTRR